MKKLLVIFSFLCTASFAEPINIVVTSTPGGNIDILARTIAKEIQDVGYENVIFNQGGANGDIAYNQVMNKPNNSILVGALHNFMMSHVLSSRENFHTQNMKIIGPVVEPSFAFISGMKGFVSFEEMIQYAKNNILPCGVPGSTGIELLRMNREYGTKFDPIQYKGSPQVKLDVLNNELKCAFDAVGSYTQENENKTVKVLAETRNTIKDVPTIKNLFKNYKYEVWLGIAIPNNSKLLQDKKLMDLLTNISKNGRILEYASARNLFILTPEPDINNHIQQLTNRYKNLIK